MAKTILIIEDDKDILDMMSYILDDDGFRVISSQDRVSSSYIRELDPALVLLDNRLAERMGCDLCLELKNDPSTSHFPVILVSAVNQLAKIAEASHADAYLNKPFDLDELVSIVRRFT